ncbi:MAG: hypothetical protein IKO76_06415 [Butyrivibrio sp.]|nr:hypothetical protein [Butyrivibrio sp.]
MRKNLFLRTTAVCTSLILSVAMPAITVYANNPVTADGQELTIDEDVVTTDAHGVVAINDSDVVVNGSITAEGTYVENQWPYAVSGVDADASDVVVEGDIKADGKGIFAQNGAYVEAGGDVTGKEAGISARGTDTVVVVTDGNVDADKDGDHPTAVIAEDGALVDITGNVTSYAMSNSNGFFTFGDGIIARGDAFVHVDGNVSSTGWAIAADDSDVTIEGDVKGFNGVALNAQNGSNIIVNGNVSAGRSAIIAVGDTSNIRILGNVEVKQPIVSNPVGISINGDQNIFVVGDVTSNTGNTVQINLDEANGSGKLILNGTVGGEKAGLYITADETSGITGTAVLNKLPTISLFRFSDALANDILLAENLYSSESERDQLYNNIKNNIRYIIHGSTNMAVSSNFDVNDRIGYMRLGDTITVTVDDGYELSGSDTIQITPGTEANTYSVSIINPVGGVSFTAIKKAVSEITDTPVENIDIVADDTKTSADGEQTSGNTSSQDQAKDTQSGAGTDDSAKTDSNAQSNATATSNADSASQRITVVVTPASSEQTVSAPASAPASAPVDMYNAPAGAIVVNTGSVAVAPLTVAGTDENVSAPARAVSLDIGKVTSAQYKEAVVDNINKTPAGSSLRIETNKVACFDTKMLETFANKNIDVEVLFPIGGQKFRVVIPKGYDIKKLLDPKGYCGFLRLVSILGAQAVK